MPSTQISHREFILDYEDEEDEENSSDGRRKKAFMQCWSEEVHDESFVRLFEFSPKRALEELDLLNLTLISKPSLGKRYMKATKSQKSYCGILEVFPLVLPQRPAMPTNLRKAEDDAVPSKQDRISSTPDDAVPLKRFLDQVLPAVSHWLPSALQVCTS